MQLTTADLQALFGVGHRVVASREQIERAHGLVLPEGKATAADAMLFEKHLAQLPPQAIAFLRETRFTSGEGLLFRVGTESVTDVFPELSGVRPRGWPPGSSWDHVGGAYNPSKRTIAVSMTKRHHLVLSGSYDMVLHEAMHGVDDAGGYPSLSPDFLAAYQVDKPKLDAYLRQDGDAGPSEAFAEVGARYYAHDPSLAKDHPNLFQYFATHTEAIFAKRGPAPSPAAPVS